MVAIEFAGDWLLKNEESLKPPACSKLMFDGKLKVFFVGGPNEGSEFLVQENEKAIYAVNNNILIKVVEKDKIKDISLKQGDIFVLPAKVEHRIDCVAGSIACIIEREHKSNQLKGIRFFKNNTAEVLWEYWYQTNYDNMEIYNIVSQYQSGKLPKNSKNPLFQIDRSASFPDPIHLQQFIDENRQKIDIQPFQLFSAKKFKCILKVYGKGLHSIKCYPDEEIILIPQRGNVVYFSEETNTDQTLKEFDIVQIQSDTIFKFEIFDNGACLSIQIKD